MRRRRTVQVRRQCLPLSPDDSYTSGQYSNVCNFRCWRTLRPLPCRHLPAALPPYGGSTPMRILQPHRVWLSHDMAPASWLKYCCEVFRGGHWGRLCAPLHLCRYRSRRPQRVSYWESLCGWHHMVFLIPGRQVKDLHLLHSHSQGRQGRHQTLSDVVCSTWWSRDCSYQSHYSSLARSAPQQGTSPTFGKPQGQCRREMSEWRSQSTWRATPRWVDAACHTLCCRIRELNPCWVVCCCPGKPIYSLSLLFQLSSASSPPSPRTSWCLRLLPLAPHHQMHWSIPILLRTHPQRGLRSLHSWVVQEVVLPRSNWVHVARQEVVTPVPVLRCVYAWWSWRRPWPVRAFCALLTI